MQQRQQVGIATFNFSLIGKNEWEWENRQILSPHATTKAVVPKMKAVDKAIGQSDDERQSEDDLLLKGNKSSSEEDISPMQGSKFMATVTSFDRKRTPTPDGKAQASGSLISKHILGRRRMTQGATNRETYKLSQRQENRSQPPISTLQPANVPQMMIKGRSSKLTAAIAGQNLIERGGRNKS